MHLQNPGLLVPGLYLLVPTLQFLYWLVFSSQRAPFSCYPSSYDICPGQKSLLNGIILDVSKLLNEAGVKRFHPRIHMSNVEVCS